MPAYKLTEGAEQDLKEIFRFTRKTWGEAQLQQYCQALQETLEAIAGGVLAGGFVMDNLPEVQVIRFRQHYIFYMKKNRPYVTVIAILHEKQHMLARLQGRLPGGA